MQVFQGNPFLYMALAFVAFGALFALRWALASWTVARDAAADYDYRQPQGMIPNGLSRERYEAIYRRVFAPRAPLYVAGTVLAILIVTPLAMVGLEQGLNLAYNLSGQSRVIEPGYLVWQFFLYFGLLFVWGGVAYLAARQYHRRTPGSLTSEINAALYGDEG